MDRQMWRAFFAAVIAGIFALAYDIQVVATGAFDINRYIPFVYPAACAFWAFFILAIARFLPPHQTKAGHSTRL